MRRSEAYDGELPEGWARTQVADLCDLNPPKPAATEVAADTLVTFVPMPAVDARARAITKPQSRAFSEVRKGFTSFRDDDVILAKITPCFENGKAALCRGLLHGLGFGSTEFHVLRSTGAVLPEYVYHFTRQDSFLRDGEANMTGSVGQKRVPADWLAARDIPLPPFAEQKRIVAKVEEVLRRVNAAWDRLATVPAILKRFRQAVLAAACSGRLTADWRELREVRSARTVLAQIQQAVGEASTRRGVPERVSLPEHLCDLQMPPTWALVSVAELLRAGALIDVKDGNHGANHPKVDEFTAQGTPFITAAQVNRFQVDYETAYKVSGPALARLRVGFAEEGDAILTHKGSVGRSALNTRPCILTPQTTYYRCNREAIHPAYLVHLFASPQFYGQLAQVMSQTTRDFVPISEQYLLHLVLPPPPEQVKIVCRVEALFALADKIEARVKAATARVEKVTQAILAKAFRGELVPTEAELARREGRDYEPADKLLARIAAARQNSPPPPKRPRRARSSRRQPT